MLMNFFYQGLLKKAIEFKASKCVVCKSKNYVISSNFLLNLQVSFEEFKT